MSQANAKFRYIFGELNSKAINQNICKVNRKKRGKIKIQYWKIIETRCGFNRNVQEIKCEILGS